MADELLKALAQRQRESDSAQPPIPLDDFEGEAGDALLDEMFGALDETAESKPAPPVEEVVADNVTALPTRKPAVWAGVGILIAAAASLVLWLAMPSPVDPLPAYSATRIAGGAAAVRGDRGTVATEVRLERADDNIEWIFSPATPVQGELEVVLSARLPSGERVFSTVSNASFSPSGSVRLAGPLDSFIQLGEGHWTVEVILARAKHAPGSAEEADRADWPTHEIEVMIAAP